jgi:hypothetical protein
MRSYYKVSRVVYLFSSVSLRPVNLQIIYLYFYLSCNTINFRQNSIVLYGEGILQKVNDNNDDIPDERVVHKLKSSLSYLKKSIVNYFDGILEQNEIFKD